MSNQQKSPGIAAGRGRGRPILGQGASSQMPRPGASPNQGPRSPTSPNVTPPAPLQAPVPYSSLSAEAPVFVPRKACPTVQTVDPVKLLRNTISVVISSPADFDALLPTLTMSLSAAIRDEETLLKIIDEIVQQAIYEANFRYTAARICDYFSRNLTVQFASGNFRQHLLKRCHAEHSKREETMKDSSNIPRIIGFTLFMGELLLNVTVGEGQRMKILAKAVQELLSTLLGSQTEASLKCTVQVLKLTGAILEEIEVEENNDRRAPNMDKVFSLLRDAIVDSQASKSVKRMLLSVVELRAGRWGRGAESQASSQPAPLPSEAVTIGGVYYDQNGQTYTYEDAAYCEEDVEAEAEANAYYQQCTAGDASDYCNQDDPYNQLPSIDAWSNQDGMDDEIASAFEEFLDMQEIARNNAANHS